MENSHLLKVTDMNCEQRKHYLCHLLDTGYTNSMNKHFLNHIILFFIVGKTNDVDEVVTQLCSS